MTHGVNGMGGPGPVAPQRIKDAGMSGPGPKGTVRKMPDVLGSSPTGGSPQVGSQSPVAGKTMRPTAISQPASLVSRELRGIVRDISSQPPVDVSKVERLAGMVSSGGYRVDAPKLADAMIASEALGFKSA